MRHPSAITAALAALALVAGAAIAGCGGDDTSTTAATGSPAPDGAALEIAMGDDFFDPDDATAEAGTVTISAPNNGALEHELILAKTNADPADLPTTASGDADEEKLEKEDAGAGEIPEVAPGESGEADFDLSPGHYVMYCNVPGHYAEGMYGTLTVK
jgi:uncharacterized cupredoxin-like copper-binding protein